MATDNNIKNFTALDIEKYHRGMLSPTERHALEKAALDDPFLADALEGYAAGGVNVSADIADLKKRLEEKTEKAKVIPLNRGSKTSFRWWRAAAAAILLTGGGLFTYQIVFNDKKGNTIAQTPPPAANETSQRKDSGSALTNNTNTEVTPGNKTDFPTGNTSTHPATEKKHAVTNNGSSSVTKDTGSISGDIAPSSDMPVTPTAAPSRMTDDKNQQGLVSNQNTQPAAATAKQRENDLSANSNKTVADEAGRANQLEQAAIAKNEDNKARAARKQESNFYRNNTNLFRGRVTDANNNGIPFANVTNTQDNVGTYTDARGYFNLTSTDSTLQVQTRALGFNNYNIQLRSSQPENRIVMQEDQAVAARTLSDRKVNYERRSRDAHFKLEGEPEPEDGWDSYDSYLANNINIPKEFKPTQTSNPEIVEVSFEVNKNGEPVNFKVEKSLCAPCDQEAIRLIKEGPKWKRKARKGRTTVAIAF